MALPSSGTLRLKQIGAEFGTSPTLKTNYGSGGAPSSGEISIKDFYGRAATIIDTIETSGSIYTETDVVTSEIFRNAAVSYDDGNIGATYAGAGYDGTYFYAIMGVTAAYLNNNYSQLRWTISTVFTGTVSTIWSDYTFPGLGYTIAYVYDNSGAQTVYSQMGNGSHPTYEFIS